MLISLCYYDILSGNESIKDFYLLRFFLWPWAILEPYILPNTECYYFSGKKMHSLLHLSERVFDALSFVFTTARRKWTSLTTTGNTRKSFKVIVVYEKWSSVYSLWAELVAEFLRQLQKGCLVELICTDWRCNLRRYRKTLLKSSYNQSNCDLGLEQCQCLY